MSKALGSERASLQRLEGEFETLRDEHEQLNTHAKEMAVALPPAICESFSRPQVSYPPLIVPSGRKVAFVAFVAFVGKRRENRRISNKK